MNAVLTFENLKILDARAQKVGQKFYKIANLM